MRLHIDRNRNVLCIHHVGPKLVNAMSVDTIGLSDDAWLNVVVRSLQVTAARAIRLEPGELHDAIASLSRELPAPRTPANGLILGHLLLTFAAHCGSFLHAQTHHFKARVSCSFEPERFLRFFWQDLPDDPRADLASWADMFFAAFAAVHPPSVAMRVADTIRRHYDRPWTIRSLATHHGVGAATLVRDFEREYELSIPKYVRVVRVVNTLEHLMTDKAEAVALDVGYQSKKNWYHALRELTGLTPTQLRALPSDELRQVLESSLRPKLRKKLLPFERSVHHKPPAQ